MLYIQIQSPNGQDLGSTPINQAIAPCDGSYGLIEFLDDNTDRADEIEGALIDLLRDGCEPISEFDFDPREGMTAEYQGFKATIVEIEG